MIKGSSTTDTISDLDGAEISSDIITDYASTLEKVKFDYAKLVWIFKSNLLVNHSSEDYV